MTRYLILTENEAGAVRGPTADGSALDPVALKDGTFALPVSVLDDPEHSEHWAFLAPLPEREIGPDDLLPDEDQA